MAGNDFREVRPAENGAYEVDDGKNTYVTGADMDTKNWREIKPSKKPVPQRATTRLKDM